jgi:TusA-related sulfurtransferase
MSKQTPEPTALLDSPGTSCANLTPLIREHILPLASGQVLEVRSNDPAAREGVPAWSRLTGHPLVQVVEVDASNTRFFLRRK